MQCPKCGIVITDPKIKNCLLCGTVLVAAEAVSEQPKSEKMVEVEKCLKTTQVEDSQVPAFDSTGGFSKKNSKKDIAIEQLKADKEAIEKRLNGLVEVYNKEHPKGKSWYTSIGNWFVILLVLALFYLIYWFYQAQGGLPHEFYDLLRRIGL